MASVEATRARSTLHIIIYIYRKLEKLSENYHQIPICLLQWSYWLYRKVWVKTTHVLNFVLQISRQHSSCCYLIDSDWTDAGLWKSCALLCLGLRQVRNFNLLAREQVCKGKRHGKYLRIIRRYFLYFLMKTWKKLLESPQETIVTCAHYICFHSKFCYS